MDSKVMIGGMIVELSLVEFANSLAQVLQCKAKQIEAAVQLFDSGCTIPFIARYRKEVTQGLDEIALRAIEDALAKARELAARKTTILKTIHEQGLLTEELTDQILHCSDSQTLETIYLPYKPKRDVPRKRISVTRKLG